MKGPEGKQAAPPDGELFDKFSQATLTEMRSMMHVVSYPAGSVLFSKKDMPELVYVVLEGEVELSINSSEGKRLILRIARRARLSGSPRCFRGIRTI